VVGRSRQGLRPHHSLTQRWYAAAQIRALDIRHPLTALERQRHLVIDDLGVEYGDKSGVWQSRIDALLDARYRDYRKTIITTNLDPKAIAERYGQRVGDRLREDTVWFRVPGRSRRGL
jgi:DNA replication protein DnaC